MLYNVAEVSKRPSAKNLFLSSSPGGLLLADSWEATVRRCLCLLILLIATPVTAAVHHVPSEYATIQAGINACAEGDTVLVAPGTYTGIMNRDLLLSTAGIALLSELGSGSTIIDCEQQMGITVSTGLDNMVVIQGFTITNANGGWEGAGGIHCWSSNLTGMDLVFYQCFGVSFGGAMRVQDSHVRLEAVRFDDCAAGECWDLAGSFGGGIYAKDSTLELTGCEFIDNVAFVGCGTECCAIALGGGIYATTTDGGSGSLIVSETMFASNRVWTYTNDPLGGTAIFSQVPSLITNSTIDDGQSVIANPSAAVECTDTATIQRCIFKDNGRAVVGDKVAVSCSAFNGQLDDAAWSIQGGNFAMDPQFCGTPGSENYFLQADSPCLPTNNDCGVLIGAYGQGCDLTPVFLTSFTASPAPGAVDLSWQLGSEQPLVDFDLWVEQDGAAWQIPWQEDGLGAYSAMDDSPSLAPGGFVTYRLSGKLPGEDWQLLRTLAVEVPPASGTQLLAPYPNPFNPATELGFVLAEPANVNLTIYDLTGRQVANLLVGAPYDAGRHAVTWAGHDDAGWRLGSGVYFARFIAGGYSAESKLVLLK